MNPDRIKFYYDLKAVILLAVPVSISLIKLSGYELLPAEILPPDRKIVILLGGTVFGILYFVIKHARFRSTIKTTSERQDFPQVFAAIERLCSRIKIDLPEVGFLDSSIPNAFVYKYNNGAKLMLTIPLIEILDDKELETVLAHELTHIKNNDLELRKYSLLLRFSLLFNPLIHLIEPFISRSREYLADETAAWITNAPQKLASALLKIEEYSSSYKGQRFLSSAPIPPEVFFFETDMRAPHIFSRSPSTEKRIKRLISLSSQMADRLNFGFK